MHDNDKNDGDDDDVDDGDDDDAYFIQILTSRC